MTRIVEGRLGSPRNTLGTMSANVVYIGLRGPQPEHGHGGPSVVGVHRDGVRSNLFLRNPHVVSGEFEWGYEGAGPRRLAQAILDEFLGFSVDPVVASAFLRDVVAGLPRRVRAHRAGGRVMDRRASRPRVRASFAGNLTSRPNRQVIQGPPGGPTVGGPEGGPPGGGGGGGSTLGRPDPEPPGADVTPSLPTARHEVVP